MERTLKFAGLYYQIINTPKHLNVKKTASITHWGRKDKQEDLICV
jgi:hypothetical protein